MFTIVGGQVIAGQLFGVTQHDPLALSIATAVLAAFAFGAAIVAAHRATKNESILALRAE